MGTMSLGMSGGLLQKSKPVTEEKEHTGLHQHNVQIVPVKLL